MRERIYKLLLIAWLLPAPAWAQHNERSVYIKNGIQLNRADLKILSGTGGVTDVNNTFCQAIGTGYTHVRKKGLLLSTGFDIGYERYSYDIKFPFMEYGFAPQARDADYACRLLIPYVQLNIGVGYRFNNLKKWQPELRLGQVLHIPLAQQSQDHWSLATNGLGYEHMNFIRTGYFGKNEANSLAVQSLNTLYIGTCIPREARKGQLSLGLQLQRQLYLRNYTSKVQFAYYDTKVQQRSVEKFHASRTTASIVLGVTF